MVLRHAEAVDFIQGLDQQASHEIELTLISKILVELGDSKLFHIDCDGLSI